MHPLDTVKRLIVAWFRSHWVMKAWLVVVVTGLFVVTFFYGILTILSSLVLFIFASGIMLWQKITGRE